MAMMKERNMILPSQIKIKQNEGYTGKEQETIANIIADLSVEYWIQTEGKISKILIYPQLNLKVILKYKDNKGEWQQNLDNGWIRFTPRGTIISKELQIFGHTIRVGDRSCIIKFSITFSTESSEKIDKIILKSKQ